MSNQPVSHSLSEIAASLGLTACGDGSIRLSGVAEPGSAAPDQIALAMKPAYAEALPKGQARAAMLWEGADWQGLGLEGAILAPRPRFALSGLSALMDPGQGYPTGIHPTAIVEDGVKLGADVTIGPWTYVGAGSRIGDGAVLGPHVHVGPGVTLGDAALIHSGARIMASVTIGARFVLHSNAVIGADGFSFVTPEASSVEQARKDLSGQSEAETQPWARIHSLGAVTIGNDVEIGVGSAVDRGTVRDTVIGDGSKLDNLVQIGHNVVVGRDCLLCSQVGIAGSTVVGDGVVMAGKVGVSDNLRIGDRAILGGATVILSNVPAGRVMLGYPAMKMDAHIEASKGLRRLPRLFRDVAELKERVKALMGEG